MTALAFAYGAGLLSTVNPCGFALLPAFLAVSVGQERGGRQQGTALRFLHGMTIGLALSAGFAAVFMTVGILLAVGLHSLITVVPWLAVGIGAVLALVGLALLSGRHIGLSIGSGTARRTAGGTHRRVLLFGMGYAVASLSCTLAVFLAVIAPRRWPRRTSYGWRASSLRTGRAQRPSSPPWRCRRRSPRESSAEPSDG